MKKTVFLNQLVEFVTEDTECFIGGGVVAENDLSSNPIYCIHGLFDNGGYDKIIKIISGQIARVAYGKGMPVSKVLSAVVHDVLLSEQERMEQNATDGGTRK